MVGGSGLIHLAGGFCLAVVIDLAAVMELKLGVHRRGFVAKGGGVMETAVSVIHRGG